MSDSSDTLERRAFITEGPTITGPEGLSWGKRIPLRAAPAPTTDLSRLEIGRRTCRRANPDKSACTGVHFRSVLRFAPDFHPTRPCGFVVLSKARYDSCSCHSLMIPSSGLIRDFHPYLLCACPAQLAAFGLTSPKLPHSLAVARSEAASASAKT